MPITKYTKDIENTEHFKNGRVNTSKLRNEIHSGNSGINIQLSHITTVGTVLDAYFKDALPAEEEAAFHAVCLAHDGEPDSDASIQLVRLVHEDSLDPSTTNTRLEGFEITIPAGETGHLDISFPYPVDLESGEGFVPAAKAGDVMDFYVAPDSPIGVLTANADAGQNKIMLPVESLPYIKPGFDLRIGTPTDTLHEVAEVNYVTGEVTLRSNLATAKSAGDAALRTVVYARNILLEANEVLSIGGQIFGSASIPPNTTLRVVYVNNDSQQKTIRFRLVYKY